MKMAKAVAKVMHPAGFAHNPRSMHMKSAMVALMQEVLVIWNWFFPKWKTHPSSESSLKVPNPKQLLTILLLSRRNQSMLLLNICSSLKISVPDSFLYFLFKSQWFSVLVSTEESI